MNKHHARKKQAPGGVELHPVLKVALVCQGLAIAAALFLPFGFDHPSKLGLDFEDFVLLLVVHGIVLTVGVVVALATHRYRTALAQLAVTGVIVYLALSGALGI